MSDCIRCTRPADFCAHHVAEQEQELRAEVKDLKARLRAIRRATGYLQHADAELEDHERLTKYATDLRMRNWRNR